MNSSLCATKLVFYFGKTKIILTFAPPKTEMPSADGFRFGDGDLVAQLVEHNTFNVGVLGSSPSGITESQATDFDPATIEPTKTIS